MSTVKANEDDPGVDHQRRDRKRGPRKATKTYLENAALYYLGRFASSTENLRRILMRKVQRSAHHHDTDPDEGAAWIKDIIDRFCRSGLLDDLAYAEARATDLHRRGTPLNGIRFKLRQKGLGNDAIDQAVDRLREEDPDADQTAAIALARRRRLGPFSTGDTDARAAARDKHLATLARAGFDYETARRIIDAETIEDLNGD